MLDPHFHLSKINNSIEMEIREKGFEPGNPLRDKLLKLSPLTAWLPLQANIKSKPTIKI